MKTYTGERIETGCEVYVTEDGKMYPLDLHLDIWNHSPAGFEWGYAGSGVAQLALAILADYLGPAQAPALCPYCGSKMQQWKCTEAECAYDGRKEDKWAEVVRLHQPFKFAKLTGLRTNFWYMTGQQIQEWLDSVRKGETL